MFKGRKEAGMGIITCILILSVNHYYLTLQNENQAVKSDRSLPVPSVSI